MGLESFCWYLNGIGRRAWLVGPPVNAIALQGSPIDYVNLRAGGFVGIRQTLGYRAFGVRIGGLPVAGRQVLPIQYFWAIRLAKLAQPWYATKLVRRGGAIGWSGGGLGEVLARDPAVNGGVGHVGWDDSLEIVAEPANGLVRIVHRRAAVLEYNLLAGDPSPHFHRNHASPELVACFERIATIVKS